MQNNQFNQFDQYKRETAHKIKRVLKRLESEESQKYVDFSDYPIQNIQKEICDLIAERLNLPDLPHEKITIRIPPSHIDADLSVEIYHLANWLDREPELLAEEIGKPLSERNELNWIDHVFTQKDYVNLNLKKEITYTNVLSNITKLDDNYGENDLNQSKRVLIDYSSPNIAKPLGIHHLRSTLLGEALANIYAFTGYSVIRDNHLGDWGLQIAELIYAYKNWGSTEKLAKNPMNALKKLYVKFHRQSEKEQGILREARKIFWKLEKKEPKYLAYWKTFRDLSIVTLNNVYERLGIEFDLYLGESYFLDYVTLIVDKCIESGVAQQIGETGVVLVDSLNDLPAFLLRKLDGSSLYITRDLSALQFRIRTFDVDEILYVVGNEQELNFRQLFELAKKIGLLKDKTLHHIGFGLLLVNGKKMSTRVGTAMDMEDFIDTAIDKAQKFLQAKNPDWSTEEMNQISEKIGVGCVLCNFLSCSNIRNINLDLTQMLDFKSCKSIYLQYTGARILSILKKYENEFGGRQRASDALIFEENIEYQIAIKAMFFPKVILNAQRSKSPHLIFNYLTELAKLFNKFYGDISVINTENSKLLTSRILLIKSVFIIIRNGLRQLNIKIPEKM